MSEEAFGFLNTDWFFDRIAVADEDGCSEYNILVCLTNEISDLFHYCVINKRSLGSQLGTAHTLLRGVFLVRVDFLRGWWSMREAESIDH